MKSSPLRDQRIGRLLAARGCRAIQQAEHGGSPHDNVLRMADWRNRAAVIPLETKLKPVGYVPIPRWKSLVPIYY